MANLEPKMLPFFMASRRLALSAVAIFSVFVLSVASYRLVYLIVIGSEGTSHVHPVKDNVPTKYFHEATFDTHYDHRFGLHPLTYHDRRRSLSALLRAYLSRMDELEVETWLMHGSLLGWYWNQKILPWDNDLDAQLSEPSLEKLSSFHNMTVHNTQGADYLLEVNPNWSNADPGDVSNKIDARWIDMDSGLYVDITVLRHDINGMKGSMICKDSHHYMHNDIFPLHNTTFEDVLAKVPVAYTRVLGEEYGFDSMNNTEYAGHHFDSVAQEWRHMEGVREQ